VRGKKGGGGQKYEKMQWEWGEALEMSIILCHFLLFLLVEFTLIFGSGFLVLLVF